MGILRDQLLIRLELLPAYVSGISAVRFSEGDFVK
jgi:hypothetical protein